MGFVKNFIETYRTERDKRRKQLEKYRIEYAFTSGGTKYYRYADIVNLPYQRGLAALMAYNELEMRCSRAYLFEHVDAMHNLLHSKTIDIFKIEQLNEILKQRLSLITDVDLLYKLASIVFFDGSENPSVYEPDYAEKKIAKWRKDAKVSDFFSQKPLRELMPFLENVGVDLDIFTETNEQINKLHEKAVHIANCSE